MVVREITVIKRPRNDKIEDRPISFPPLQNLHLTLMENKKKLKKNLPIVQIKKQPPKPEELNVKPYTPDMMAGKAPVNVIKKAAGSIVDKGQKIDAAEKVKENGVKKEEDLSKKGHEGEAKKDRSKKEGHKKDRTKKDSEEDRPKKEGHKKDRTKKELEDRSKDRKKDKRSKEDEIEDVDDAAEEPEEISEEPEVHKEEVYSPDEIENELGEDGDEERDDNSKESPNPDVEGSKAAEGEEVGEEDADIYAGLSPEERERQEREEYIWRFKIMKKKYRNRNIPEFNEHDDLEMMKTTYQRSLKEISLDENVDSYRMYLQFGFMGMEYVATQWLGIDLTGFAKQQMASMHKYDSLLIELGEKSQSRWLSNLPVEVRLIGFIIIQAGIFYVGKMIAGNVNEGVADFFRGMMGQSPQSASTGVPGPAGAGGAADAPKKKMRGPSIKAEDIKKMKEQDV